MTENEAIKQFEERVKFWDGNESEATDYIEAMKISMSALKEIQKYRTTGMTPERIKEMQRDYVVKSQLFEEYRNIGTVDECREAVGKMKPKTVVVGNDNGHKGYICPDCGVILCNGRKNYCSRCGQKLDWEGLNDNN